MGKVKEHLISLTDAVEAAYQKAKQADWDGTPSQHLWEQYRSLKARLDNGELYDPLF